MRIDRWIIAVGRDLVVQIGRGSVPIPFGHHDIALDTGRTRRIEFRQFALGDAFGPIAKICQRALRVEAADRAHHRATGLAGLQAAFPCRGGRIEMSQHRRDRACRLVAELMTGDAAIRLHVAQPYALIGHLLRHVVAGRTCSREEICRRNLHHRIPILRRIILRRRRAVRSRDRLEVQQLAGRCFHLW